MLAERCSIFLLYPYKLKALFGTGYDTGSGNPYAKHHCQDVGKGVSACGPSFAPQFLAFDFALHVCSLTIFVTRSYILRVCKGTSRSHEEPEIECIFTRRSHRRRSRFDCPHLIPLLLLSFATFQAYQRSCSNCMVCDP